MQFCTESHCPVSKGLSQQVINNKRFTSRNFFLVLSVSIIFPSIIFLINPNLEAHALQGFKQSLNASSIKV